MLHTTSPLSIDVRLRDGLRVVGWLCSILPSSTRRISAVLCLIHRIPDMTDLHVVCW